MFSLCFHLFPCPEESLQLCFIFVVSTNLLVFAVYGLVSAVYVMMGLIAVLYILDFASMPMFLLRHIVAFRQAAIFIALVVCFLTSASTSS